MLDFRVAKTVWPEMVEAAMSKALRAAALDIHGAIVDRITTLQVVDTGTFRANWHITADAESFWWQMWQDTAPQAVMGVRGQVKSDSKVYIQNNLPYAEALETGHSMKAPAGIIGPLEEELKRIHQSHLAGVMP